MRRIVPYLTIFTILVSMSLFFVPTTWAKIISSEKSVTVEKDEVVDDDLFVSGEEINIEGTVNGDVFAAGANVSISGIVNGDVFAVGGMLEISGEIKDDLRVAGGNISIQGATIGDSLTVAGGNVNIEGESPIGGGVLFGAGSLNLKTDVGRGVMGGGGAVNINSIIGKDVYVGAEELTLGPDTVVVGNLVYDTENEIEMRENATVAGSIRKIIPEARKATIAANRVKVDKMKMKGFGTKFKLGLALWSYLAALIVGLLMTYLFKKPSREIVNTLQKSWLSSLGWGFLLIVLAFPAFFMLLVTGIGIPLALILAMLFMIELYLAKIVVGMALGQKIAEVLGNKKMNTYFSFTLGLAGYYVLGVLPYVGGFVKLFALLLGLGAIFSYKKTRLAKA